MEAVVSSSRCHYNIKTDWACFLRAVWHLLLLQEQALLMQWFTGLEILKYTMLHSIVSPQTPPSTPMPPPLPFPISLPLLCPCSPFPFIPHLLLRVPPCSLSLSGSLPSVCLCAWGAGCYLDDLVREGERDFISCLPEGLWYLWCYKAALLKKSLHSSVEHHGSAG